jgi:hypothetical membrane protein
LRSGFSLADQPISFLMLGDLGFLERATFLLTAGLVVTFALGLRRQGTVGRWVPRLLIGLGVGLAIAGLFPPDPGFGFPAGTPSGPPAETTYRSALHGVGFALSFLSFAIACAVYARRAFQRGDTTFGWYTCLSAAGALALGMWPGEGGLAVRDLIAAALLWAWVTALALQAIGRTPGRRAPGTARAWPFQ